DDIQLSRYVICVFTVCRPVLNAFSGKYCTCGFIMLICVSDQSALGSSSQSLRTLNSTSNEYKPSSSSCGKKVLQLTICRNICCMRSCSSFVSISSCCGAAGGPISVDPVCFAVAAAAADSHSKQNSHCSTACLLYTSSISMCSLSSGQLDCSKSSPS